MNDTLVMAKKEDFDVFNALSLMDNMEFLQELKFGPGDGDLMYYLYNWRCPRMEGNKGARQASAEAPCSPDSDSRA
ncbi:Glycylpeptide N-tetradecanoyltransferase 2 [Phytophthora ramorum]|nr:Glycylpeptide N-tetradecanoyltransferase 2 [Phytophthora ramorum]